jgi:hypothetical protein
MSRSFTGSAIPQTLTSVHDAIAQQHVLADRPYGTGPKLRSSDPLVSRTYPAARYRWRRKACNVVTAFMRAGPDRQGTTGSY